MPNPMAGLAVFNGALFLIVIAAFRGLVLIFEWDFLVMKSPWRERKSGKRPLISRPTSSVRRRYGGFGQFGSMRPIRLPHPQGSLKAKYKENKGVFNVLSMNGYLRSVLKLHWIFVPQRRRSSSLVLKFSRMIISTYGRYYSSIVRSIGCDKALISDGVKAPVVSFWPLGTDEV